MWKQNAMSISRTCPPVTNPLALTLVLCAATITGCGEGSFDATLDQAVKSILNPRKTPQQYMVLAVSSEDPDVRRDAVARVSDSKKYDEDWAVKGFIAIACLENDPQTRCVAIRALARSRDPRATETALKIINYRDYPPEEVWPPVEIVRWDATELLATHSAQGLVPEELRADVQQTLIDRLRLDSNRHARVAAARGLGYYPRPTVVEALITGLRDENFAVVHECEGALVKLTGHSHGGSVLAWEEWWETNQGAPFADAGHVPEDWQPPYDNKWEKFSYETKDFVRWLWPGAKEE